MFTIDLQSVCGLTDGDFLCATTGRLNDGSDLASTELLSLSFLSESIKLVYVGNWSGNGVQTGNARLLTANRGKTGLCDCLCDLERESLRLGRALAELALLLLHLRSRLIPPLSASARRHCVRQLSKSLLAKISSLAQLSSQHCTTFSVSPFLNFSLFLSLPVFGAPRHPYRHAKILGSK